jgi:hypothetical protein
LQSSENDLREFKNMYKLEDLSAEHTTDPAIIGDRG